MENYSHRFSGLDRVPVTEGKRMSISDLVFCIAIRVPGQFNKALDFPAETTKVTVAVLPTVPWLACRLDDICVDTERAIGEQALVIRRLRPSRCALLCTFLW